MVQDRRSANWLSLHEPSESEVSHSWPIIDFEVGDLVSYRTSTGIMGSPPYLGMVRKVCHEPAGLLGHLEIYWIKHDSFKGQVKCHYPADLKKILDKT